MLILRTTLLAAGATNTTEAAPWWGVPVVAGGFLLLGAVLGHYFSKRQDDSKAKRALLERYMDQRLEHCSDLLSAARQVLEVLGKIGVWPATVESGTKKSDELKVAHDFIRDVSKRGMSAYSAITLISPESLRGPARNVVARMLFARIAETSGEAREAETHLKAAIGRLEAAGRKHFGVGDEDDSAPARAAKSPKSVQHPQRREHGILAWLNETL